MARRSGRGPSAAPGDPGEPLARRRSPRARPRRGPTADTRPRPARPRRSPADGRRSGRATPPRPRSGSSVALRLEPGYARDVLAAVGDQRVDPALALVAGDALRLLGRESEALAAFDLARGHVHSPEEPHVRDGRGSGVRTTRTPDADAAPASASRDARHALPCFPAPPPRVARPASPASADSHWHIPDHPATRVRRRPTRKRHRQPMADVQRTLLLVKPDGVQRLLVGRVLTRFEERGLKLVGLKLVLTDRALAEEHYAVHREKPFFAGLVDFITSGPLVAAALEGPNAIAIVRAMNGATRPHEAAPGSIAATSPSRPRRTSSTRRTARRTPRPSWPLVPTRGAARLRARDRPLGAGARGVDLRRAAPAAARTGRRVQSDAAFVVIGAGSLDAPLMSRTPQAVSAARIAIVRTHAAVSSVASRRTARMRRRPVLVAPREAIRRDRRAARRAGFAWASRPTTAGAGGR